MANGKATEQVVSMALADIAADLKWNTRSSGYLTAPGEGPGDSRGVLGLAESLEKDGQDTACVVRPNPAGKGPAYALASGFRRYEAVSRLASEKKAVKGLTVGHINVIVREMTEAEARALNVRENANRDDLSMPDLAWGMHAMSKAGLKQDQIAAELNKTQGYVSKLLRIMSEVKPAITKHWRESAVPVTLLDMTAIAQTPESEQDAKYKALCAGEGKEQKKRGPSAWVETARDRAEKAGHMLGTLERHGFIRVLTDKVDISSAINDVTKVKDTVTKKQEASIVKAFVKGYQTALGESDPEQTEDEEAAE